MNFITTTELRTKSKDLIKTLQEGRSIDLIHRSRLVGIIKPTKEQPKVFNAKKIAQIAKAMNLPKLSYAQREKRYRKHLMEKYGKGISGR